MKRRAKVRLGLLLQSQPIALREMEGGWIIKASCARYCSAWSWACGSEMHELLFLSIAAADRRYFLESFLCIFRCVHKIGKKRLLT